ncbi:MAG TPA: hypothetical protein VLJ59_07125 [Mycobacteriales bacterium]|nr:hypothetical protein [Mycobacteriales bacterium]
MQEDDGETEGFSTLRRTMVHGSVSNGWPKVRALVALFWTAGLLIFLGAVSEGAVSLAAYLGGLAAPVAAIGSYFQPRRFPKLSRQAGISAVAAVLLLDLVGTVIWAALSWYDANRAIDVTARITLVGSVDVLPDEQEHARFDVDITDPRSQIVIMFKVDDHKAEIGSCVPNTELHVTPDYAGNRGATETVTPGGSLTLNMFSHTRHLRLKIAVKNIRGDSNCAVDIAVSSAKLTNG